jgi:hypothetical protein
MPDNESIPDPNVDLEAFIAWGKRKQEEYEDQRKEYRIANKLDKVVVYRTSRTREQS